MDQKGAALPCCGGQIEGNTAVAVAESNDEIRRPGGMFQRGMRGEMERRGRAICRRGVASKQEGNRRELRGEEMRCLGLGHGGNLG
jgi:hypothetical protein